MESIQILFLTAAVCAVTLAALAGWSRRRFQWKALAVILAGALIGVTWTAFDDLLSRPKPMVYDEFEAEYLPNQTARVIVLYGEIREGAGIAMLVRLPGVTQPRYFLFDWNKKFAEELEEALRQKRREKGGELELRRRGSGQPGTEKDGAESSDEKNWSNERFSVNPAPPLPPKDAPPEEYTPQPAPSAPEPGRIQV